MLCIRIGSGYTIFNIESDHYVSKGTTGTGWALLYGLNLIRKLTSLRLLEYVVDKKTQVSNDEWRNGYAWNLMLWKPAIPFALGWFYY
jgi:hypothetical protein